MPTRFMLNIFEEEEVCVSILYRFSTLKYQKFKCFFPLILHCQCCFCGWPGDVSLTFRELLKFVYCRNSTSYDENFKRHLCTCVHALGTRTKFQLGILTINVISCIDYFREIILVSCWWNVSETPPGDANWTLTHCDIVYPYGHRYIGHRVR